MAAGLTQYERLWEIMLNGEPFINSTAGRQFRCIFDIDVSVQGAVSMADIQIYNLARTTAINQKSSIVFKAGYADRYDMIFSGRVTNVFKERREPDIITRLLCWSGDASSDRGMLHTPYGAGAHLVDVLEDIAKAWPRALEIDRSQFTDKDVFTSGWTALCDLRDALTSLKGQFDFDWQLDRGALVITRGNKPRSTTLFDVNQFTGMVGYPKMSDDPSGLFIDVSMRINPFIRSSSRINVEADFSTYNSGDLQVVERPEGTSVNGEYNVLSLRYFGDSHGDIWDMRMHCLRPGTQDPATERVKAVTGIIERQDQTTVTAADISTNDIGGGLVWGGR